MLLTGGPDGSHDRIRIPTRWRFGFPMRAFRQSRMALSTPWMRSAFSHRIRLHGFRFGLGPPLNPSTSYVRHKQWRVFSERSYVYRVNHVRLIKKFTTSKSANKNPRGIFDKYSTHISLVRDSEEINFNLNRNRFSRELSWIITSRKMAYTFVMWRVDGLAPSADTRRCGVFHLKMNYDAWAANAGRWKTMVFGNLRESKSEDTFVPCSDFTLEWKRPLYNRVGTCEELERKDGWW